MTNFDTSINQIIFVDDEASFREAIGQYLHGKGYRVTSVGSAIEFYKEFERRDYALAIIDIGLPDQSGLVLARYVRANALSRIILLTGDTSSEAMIAGFEAGADQFLTKPVNFRLLDAALSSLMMRATGCTAVTSEMPSIKPESAFHSHIWRLLAESWELVTPTGEKLHLTAKEYAFLHFLTENPNVSVLRRDLLERLGYPRDEHGSRSLESLIYRLRKKISPNLETPIKTVNGEGYIFTAKIEIES